MSNAPVNEFGSTYRRLSVVLPVRHLTAPLWRLFRVWVATTASQLRERTLRRAERHSATTDRSFSRLHRNVLKIEARRLL